MTYSEKLRDPRWQKKRLEIFERDDFCCRYCFCDDKTLHVHHLLYHKDREPWEYENDCLITACEDCHKVEADRIGVVSKDVFRELKIQMLYYNQWLKLFELTQKFSGYELFQIFDVFSSEYNSKEYLMQVVCDLNKSAYDNYCSQINTIEENATN